VVDIKDSALFFDQIIERFEAVQAGILWANMFKIFVKSAAGKYMSYKNNFG